MGIGASKIRSLFQKAKNREKSTIIFIDEIDSIGSKRGQDTGDSSQTLNQLLSEMDGFEKMNKVIVLAATNFPSSLDPALLRPGRFDKNIYIPLPKLSSRKDIFRYYLKSIKYNSLDLDTLARQSINLTGADIKNIVNIAALNAGKNRKAYVTKDDFDFAFDRLRMGVINKSINPSRDDLYHTAIHEAGHAIISLINPAAVPMDKVTILSKGGALGLYKKLHFLRT